MILRHAFPAIVGLVAALATAGILTLEVVFACGLWPSTSPIRIVAVVASVAEAVVLVLILTKISKYYRGTNGYLSRNRWGAWFASDLIASVLASVVSIVLLILIGKASDLPRIILTIPTINAVIGSAIALGFAFVGQLFFVVVYFILHRVSDSEQAFSLHTNEGGRPSSQPHTRVKTVPYDRTKPALSQSRLKEWASLEYSSRPGTSSGRSAAETITSFSGSLSNYLAPVSPRARLLPHNLKSGWRPNSLDSNAYRDRTSVTEDGFDSWDTSSVDPHNRQTVLEASSPIHTRFLEPIPGSPFSSRSPSPGFPLELESPRRGRGDRNDSPGPRAQLERAPTLSEAELNIHPLFRSDSPGPPPVTTPGTVVVAAPNAGQFITGKSVTGMRNGIWPSSPSPLSRQGSFESFRKAPSQNNDNMQLENTAEVGQRRMTPPIPDWVLNGRSQTSVSEHERKR